MMSHLRLRAVTFLTMCALPLACAGVTEPKPSSDVATSNEVAAATCRQPPACDAPPPAPSGRSFRHWLHTFLTSAGAHHRGRDLFVNPGEPQWVIGKFAYGLLDKDLEDEDVDIYVLRDCGSNWELLGTATTTQDGASHPEVEGVPDSGGRVYFQIPKDKELGPGRHRIHMVVGGDGTSADLFLEVVPPGTPLFVSDVDGTLTSSESAEVPAVLDGKQPEAHPDAAAALTRLVEKGYRPMYLTARPEFDLPRTRDFLSERGFPPGIVHTTLGATGAIGSAAADYKKAELDQLAQRGLHPAYGFGNTSSDADAYDAAGIAPASHRIFYQFTDTAHGGRRIEAYTELVPEFQGLAPVCQ